MFLLSKVLLTAALVQYAVPCAFAAQDSKHQSQDDLDVADELDSVHLMSRDGQQFSLSRKAALISCLVKHTLEENPDAAQKDNPIKVDADAATLTRIVEYLEYHHGKAPRDLSRFMPARVWNMRGLADFNQCTQCSTEVIEVISKWDIDFINKQNKKGIFQTIIGASHMGMVGLASLAVAKIGTLCRSEQEFTNVFQGRLGFRSTARRLRAGQPTPTPSSQSTGKPRAQSPATEEVRPDAIQIPSQNSPRPSATDEQPESGSPKSKIGVSQDGCSA